MMEILRAKLGFAWSVVMAIFIAVVPRYWELRVESIPSLVSSPSPAPRIEVVEDTIQKDTTLVATLVDYQVPAALAREIADLIRPVFDVRRIRFGNPFRLEKEDNGSLRAFEYKIDDERVLKVKKAADSFQASVEKLDLETRVESVTAQIDNSLWDALASYPKGEVLTDDLAEIFQWDVDFNYDIQKGDKVRLIIEEQYYEGKFIKYGRVQAAELVNAGRSYRAFLFQGEYYDEKGNALKRSWLASPLKFTRISSRFSFRRNHPILKSVRPHLATDYAAPTGTPVVSIANGAVTFAGWNEGYGNLVTVRHGNGLTSGYAHLSRIATGVKPGISIKQGELIGAVGMTGLANGPHLHFMMTKNGKPVNPVPTLKKGEPPVPIQASLRPAFQAHIAPMQTRLTTLVTEISSRLLSKAGPPQSAPTVHR